MSTITTSPEDLQYFELDTPFTADELEAIKRYKDGPLREGGYGADLLRDMIDTNHLFDRDAVEAQRLDDADPADPASAVEIDRALILACFDWLGQCVARR